MTDLVHLASKRNRAWPWPEHSFGLDSMYGPDGWCHSCGVPKREQTGALQLQQKGMKSAKGAWVPNWRYDLICLDANLSTAVASMNMVDMRPVAWRGSVDHVSNQLVAPTTATPWFDHDELEAAVLAAHRPRGADAAGSLCPECDTWKWLPLSFAPQPPLTEVVLPGLIDSPELQRAAIASSPEWFGDGFKAFRMVLIDRSVAEVIAEGAPSDLFVVQPTQPSAATEADRSSHSLFRRRSSD